MNFADPRKTVEQMGLRAGMKVGDFGVGSGHYAVAAASIVGPEGHVYAIDVQEDILKHVRFLAEQAHLHNVETIWGNFEKTHGSKLRDHTLDAAILSNVLFQLSDRAAALAEIKRTLKPGGMLLVVDWVGSFSGVGPAPEHVVSERSTEELCAAAGFTKVKDIVPGVHHYGILFSV
ncbi:MAG TPA: methyltransferase domain-containing protein [Candidatus Paceibacterota bacterium]